MVVGRCGNDTGGDRFDVVRASVRNEELVTAAKARRAPLAPRAVSRP